MEIRGKAALVTGGSRGLGAALVRELAGRGARVVAVARGKEALERAVSDAPGEAHALAADVADKEAIHAIAGEAAARVGPIDILIHDASELGPTPLRLLLDTECEDLERVLAVNLIGPFRLTRAIAGSMALRGSGVILLITSDASVEPYSRWGAYGVSKAALDHLGRIWDAELEGTGVRVIAVDPGDMDTAMHAAAIPDADPATLARPADVARKIVRIVERAESLPPSARVRAADFGGDA